MVKATAEIRSLARGHTESAISVLASIMNQKKTPPSARVAAAQVLLDRGWGKPTQPLSGDEDNPLSIVHTIRRIIVDPRHSDSESIPAAPDTSEV
jgi:hypothetical protein